MASSKTVAASGDQMVAEAFRQAQVDVMPCYPITPQTIIVEQYDKYVAEGKVHTEFIPVESEHSALAAAIGASAAGARTATATASQGLAFMWEELYAAAGMRLPIVMANANRALSAPINIHGDHSDVMGSRDAGWIMLFAEDAQEAYDNTLIAFPLAENKDVMLPVMTCLDGFITSHSLVRAELLDDESAREFVGSFEPEHSLLDTDNPVSYGMFANLGNFYMETKLAQRKAQERALDLMQELGDKLEGLTGRPFKKVKAYRMEDAERAIVVMGSATGNVRAVVDELREKGEKVGVVCIRVFRPLPAEEIKAVLSQVPTVAVMDRAETVGSVGGPLFEAISTVMYQEKNRPAMRNYMYGLGGADVTLDLIKDIFEDLKELPAQAEAHETPKLTYKGNRQEGEHANN